MRLWKLVAGCLLLCAASALAEIKAPGGGSGNMVSGTADLDDLAATNSPSALNLVTYGTNGAITYSTPLTNVAQTTVANIFTVPQTFTSSVTINTSSISSPPLFVSTSSTSTGLIVSTNNKVGIGTSNPTQLLEASGTGATLLATDSAIGVGIQALNSSSMGFVGTTTNANFGFTTNNSIRGVVDTSGNLNWGATIASAAAKLIVRGADNAIVIISSINATQANVTAADTFLSFNSNTGQEGSVAGTAAAGVLAFNTFTGSHWTRVEGFTDKEVRDSVFAPLCSTGEPLRSVQLWDATKGQKVRLRVSEKQQLVRTAVCKEPYSQAVYGFYGGRNEKTGYDMALSLGTGMAWVLNAGQDVAVGDWLVTSGDGKTLQVQLTRGLLSVGKAKDDLQHNYSAAKASQPIRWKPGEKLRKIAVTYHCG